MPPQAVGIGGYYVFTVPLSLCTSRVNIGIYFALHDY